VTTGTTGTTDDKTAVAEADASPDTAPQPGADGRAVFDVGPTAAHLRITVTRLARLLRRQGDTGLSPSQLSALTAIERQGPLTLGALADYERVAPPSITKVVAKLEDRGLVARRADDADRRVVHVSTTDAGRALLGEVRQRKDVWLAARLADLDDDQRDRLVAALDVLDELTGQDPV